MELQRVIDRLRTEVQSGQRIGTNNPPTGQTGAAMMTGINRQPHLQINLTQSRTEVSRARAATTRALKDLGFPELIDDARLIVSELVTNALDATAAGRVIFAVYHNDGRPLVEVWDSETARRPQPQRPAHMAQGGRGLLVVEELAADWGHHLAQLTPNGPPWKCVWALLK
ncbi:ATP-binding protein [Spirillospora sp. NPDC048911]|uniref:ATP-binding protein n=1 Tax=Spirillospora sp. NPDC048911 TaxID=3364527 RepID=UPI00371D7218